MQLSERGCTKGYRKNLMAVSFSNFVFFFLLYDLLSLRKFQDFEMCFGTADTVHVYNIEKVDVFFIFLTAEN